MAFLKRTHYLFFAAMLLAALLPHKAYSAELQLAEQKIKAGLLYNFLKYTTWPVDVNSATMNVCIYGGDPFGGSLKPMEGRSVNQQSIKLIQLKDISKVDGCNLLFINAAQQSNWAQLQSALAGKSILTVSDFPGFAQLGGMIEFRINNNHVEAVLNMESVNNAKLQVEKRLLKLVTLKNADPGGG